MTFLLRCSFSLLVLLMMSIICVKAQTPVFKILKDEKILPPSLLQHVKKGSVYKMDGALTTQLKNSNPAELKLQFHFENKDWQLELKPSDIFSKGFFVKTSDDQPFAYDKNTALHYKGSISGQPGSFAAVSILENEIVAVLADKNGNINIGLVKSEDGVEKNTHIIFRESDIKAPNPFTCASESLQDAGSNPLPQFGAPVSAEAVVNTEPIDVYFEADYSCYQGNGSNITNTANWVSAIFNVVNTLYENDSVFTQISGIKVWNNTDPYAALSSSSNVLYAFSANMAAGFPGDLAHILSRRSLGGGVAFLNVLCSGAASRTSVSGNLSSSFSPYPAYSWNTMVITHEMGHNIGSNHTQWCGWPGGALDNCRTPTEGGCALGPAPVNGGTIMSYCHLVGYGINLANGFGPLPGALIRNKVRTGTCLNPRISFSTNFQSVTEENTDTENGCLDYKLINLKLSLNYLPSQPAIISLAPTNVASPGLQIGMDKDVEISTYNFTLTDTIPQLIQLKVYDDAIIETKETLRLDYIIENNGTNAVKSGVYLLDILSLDHRPDSTLNQLLYTETFDNISTGLGPWTQNILHGNLSPNRWVIGDAGDPQFLTKAAFVSANGTSSGYAGSNLDDSAVIRLESPTINASGFSSLRLSYLYKVNGEGSGGQGSIGNGGGADFGNLYFSINNGSSWVLLKENIFGRNNRTLDEVVLPASANNAAGLKVAFVWQNNSAVVNNPALIIDSIVIKGTGSTPIQQLTHIGNINEAYLGPNQVVHFYNPATQNIMASITNKSNFDFGCTSVEIVRTGNAASVAWGDYNAQKITDKSYKVTAANSSPSAPYELSLYYTEEEINGWAAATGNSAAEMAIVKTSADITQAPPATAATFSNYNSVSNYGPTNGKKITATFSDFSTFSIGKAGITPICPGTSQLLSSNETGLSYQWQVNTGGGYTNLANNAFYNGATAASLSISNAPTTWYGYKYRCMITDAVGTHAGIEYLLKFAVNWMGNTNNNWETSSNWGCIYLPDANTDVFIKPGMPLYPVLSSNTAIRSLTILNGANVTVNNGVQLMILQ
ncbi:MAG: hypothetical protein H7X88_05415 [Gloeobacteraceae cyanobacterium ES-bin-316]|nr:hypothetical protein [Ferruginibacter sp.]